MNNSIVMAGSTRHPLTRVNPGKRGRIRFVAIALFVVFCLWSMENINAQTIIDDLQSQINPSDGVIHIECDPAITALIGKPNNPSDPNANADSAERQGYRIQVFMNNLPAARSEATSKQTSIRSAFPELPAYLFYDAPYWKLWVGDFITREEANIIKQRLQKEFPQFGKEMYIVPTKIKLLIER